MHSVLPSIKKGGGGGVCVWPQFVVGTTKKFVHLGPIWSSAEIVCH